MNSIFYVPICFSESVGLDSKQENSLQTVVERQSDIQEYPKIRKSMLFESIEHQQANLVIEN